MWGAQVAVVCTVHQHTHTHAHTTRVTHRYGCQVVQPVLAHHKVPCAPIEAGAVKVSHSNLGWGITQPESVGVQAGAVALPQA